MANYLVLFILGLIGGIHAQEPFTLDEYLDGTFASSGFDGTWISDTEFFYSNGTAYVIYNVSTSSNVPGFSVAETSLAAYNSTSVSLSPNRKYLLLRYNVKSLFRHSTTAQYDIFEIANSNTTKVEGGEQLRDCIWGNSENSLIYVYNNNIIIRQNNGTITDITTDGVDDKIYNGIPDWIYEEEVLYAGSAIWISPDKQYFAFARFDDTAVPDFSYVLYGEPGSIDNQYSHVVNIKYPKVSVVNPSFSVIISNMIGTKVTLTLQDSAPSASYVLYGVSWSSASSVLVLITNRIQNMGTLQNCNVTSGLCTKIKDYNQTNGWLNPNLPIYNADFSKRVEILLASNNMYPHLFTSPNILATLTQITSGYYTVTSIHGWNGNDIYFSGSLENNYAQQHVYRITDNGTKIVECLTCDWTTNYGLCQYASAYFSEYLTNVALTCRGPGPYIVNVGKSKTNVNDLLTWEDNQAIQDQLATKYFPLDVKYLSVDVGGGVLAYVKLRIPPDFNENEKYPLIVDVYAGPDSNEINDAYSVGFESYIVTNRQYIYASIDGTGSGRRGYDIAFKVYKKLGQKEILDQIAVTKYLQDNFAYVDANRTGIWGWSYGGFATGRVMILDTEKVFKFGLSVAPVTDFIYYDSIYTERYMDVYANNVAGYNATDLTQFPESFRGRNYFLVHGGGDDNVHYQQSMMLAKVLEVNDVQFRHMTYPDENHSLRGVSAHLYHMIDNFWAEMTRVETPAVQTGEGAIIQPILMLVTILAMFVANVY